MIRELEVIGEAIKNIPLEFQKEHNAVPWSDFTRLRDKLIHGYFGIDIKLTYQIAVQELPDLKK